VSQRLQLAFTSDERHRRRIAVVLWILDR